MNSDAGVIRPVLESEKGLAFAQALLPTYSAIDAYHMAACTIDEAVRRILSVGANVDHIGGVDNFCWPNIQYDPTDNPNGKFKAAQLVRASKAVRDICMAYKIPLLSGKDSMYVDGHLKGQYGETHKISALETLQFSTIGVIDDISKCVTMDGKVPGDLVYILGTTCDELGGSEYYEQFGYVGRNVPKVHPDRFMDLYNALGRAVEKELPASIHGIYRGGLGVHLAMVAMGGNLGMDIDLSLVPKDEISRDDYVLFSESAGRFIVTLDPAKRESFEKIFQECPFGHIGTLTEKLYFIIKGIEGNPIIRVPTKDLKSAWKRPFGKLI
jgi:phosphoribosylformylglycinamidine synthase